MTTREKEQLERLLRKKEEEEAAEKEFFTQVKRQRKKVVHVLGLEEAVTVQEAVKEKAEQAGMSTEELLSFVQKLLPEWMIRQLHRTE